jgi:hypothetical protein
MTQRALVVLVGLLLLDIVVFLGLAQWAGSEWAGMGSPQIFVQRQVRQEIPARQLLPFRSYERLFLPGRPLANDALSAAAAAAEAERPGALGAMPPGSSITVDRTVFEKVAVQPFGLQMPGARGVMMQLAGLSAALGLSMTAFLLFPAHLTRWSAPLQMSPGAWLRAVLLGLVGYLAMGALAFLVGVTVVGLPLVWLLVGVTVILTIGGLISVALALGTGLAKRFRLQAVTPWWALVAGAALLVPLTALPLVGWIVFAAVMLAGFGAGLWSRFGHPAGWQTDLQPPFLADA